MTTPIVLSSSIYNNLHLRSEERVIDICKLEHADVYINASGGRDLYQPNHFEAAGIKLFFIETFAEPYKQFGKEFVPGLSIIDVIMFNSGQEVRKMLLNCGVGF